MSAGIAGRGVIGAAVLGSGIVFLDSTIVTVALARIGEELPSPMLGVLEAQSFVYNGYLLTLSALLVLAGALADRLGRRRVFTWGLVGFGLTSLVCGLAPTMLVLIVGRLFQGAAGALLVPGSLAILTQAFQGRARGRAFGIWAGASAVTSIVGPPVGGLLVDAVSWRAAFLINLPFVAVGVWATRRYVEESRDPEAPATFDWPGALLLTLGVGGIVLGLVRGQETSWARPLPLVSLLVGLLAAAAVPVWLGRSPAPLVPRHLFRSRNFNVTNLSTFLVYGALYVFLYLVAIHLQGTLGYDATSAGLATVPSLVFLALFASRFGERAAERGARRYMSLGPLVMALGVLWLTRLPAESDAWRATAGAAAWLPPPGYLIDVLPAMVVFGLGVMVMVAPLTAALMGSVPQQNSGVASAFNNAVSRIGPQIAGALVFVAVSAAFTAHLTAAVPGLAPAEVREVASPLNPPAEHAPEEVVEAVPEASTRAFHTGMWILAGILLAGALVNWLGIVGNPAADGEGGPPTG